MQIFGQNTKETNIEPFRNPFGQSAEENIESFSNPFGQSATPTKSINSFKNPFGSSSPIVKPKEDDAPKLSETPTVPELEPIKAGTYSEDDLVKDKYYNRIKDYMFLRYDVDEFRGLSREEVVTKFLNTMRGFAGGNSIRAVTEISFLNSLKENKDELATVGAAYALYEGQAGLFSKETTKGEKLGIVGDFIYSAVADPINLIGLGVGKLFAAGGTKVASKVAQDLAKKEYVEVLTKQYATKTITTTAERKAAEKVATKAAEKVFSTSMINSASEVSSKIAARKVVQKGLSSNVLKNLSNKSVLTEVATITAIETVASVGTAYAYETGLVRTGAQEEVNKYSIGLAFAGSLIVGGGLGLTSTFARGKDDFFGTEQLVNPQEVIKRPPKQKGLKDLTGILDNIRAQRDKKLINAEGLPHVTYSPFKEKVAGGIKVDLPVEFWTTMMLGDAPNGIKGLTQIVHEMGYSWNKARDGEITNFLAQIIEDSDPQKAKEFLKEFAEITGMPTDKVKDLTIKEFSDSFSKVLSDAGKVQNALSQASKTLADGDDVKTLSDYADKVFGIGVKPTEKSAFGEKVDNYLTMGVTNFQNRVIRLLVSAPSTSFLNAVGYGVATSMNTATDLAMALAYGGLGGTQRILGSKTDNLRIAGQLLATTRQRVRNFLDPQMTYDAYKSLAITDPKALQQLTEVLPGGIEDMNAVIKNAGFDPNQTMIGSASESVIDFAQKVNFVQMQDVFTKSQELIYQIDKRLRLEPKFKQSFSEFYSAADSGVNMATPEYKKIIAESVYETQRAIFSKSMKNRGTTLGEIAGVVEDARNIGGVGLLVPFGRFFNNTVAFMTDVTGLSLLAKLTGRAYVKKGAERSVGEMVTRTALGWGMIASYAQQEKEYREMGLGAFERINSNTGGVVTQKYNFPISHLKAFGRYVSYWGTDQEMPEGEIKEINDVIGIAQIARALNEQVDGLGEAFITAASGSAEKKSEFVSMTLGRIPSQIISGVTRPLDPLNAAFGLFQGSDFKKLDRKQNSKFINESLRYMDNIIASFTSEDVRESMGMSTEENYTAVEGAQRGDESRNLGVREYKLTNLKAVLNMVGKPLYKMDSDSKVAEAGNRYNELFNIMTEFKAAKLRRNPFFIKGDPQDVNTLLDTRKKMVSEMLTGARDSIRRVMENNRGGSEDDSYFLKLMAVMDNHTFSQIDRAMDKLFPDKDFDPDDVTELSVGQLTFLRRYLENREEREGKFYPYKLD